MGLQGGKKNRKYGRKGRKPTHKRYNERAKARGWDGITKKVKPGSKKGNFPYRFKLGCRPNPGGTYRSAFGPESRRWIEGINWWDE